MNRRRLEEITEIIEEEKQGEEEERPGEGTRLIGGSKNLNYLGGEERETVGESTRDTAVTNRDLDTL